MPFSPPYPPYDPTDRNGFSYETLIKRWPVILTGIVDYMHNACHTLAIKINELNKQDANEGSVRTLSEKLTEGKAIIGKLSKLKYEMARDRVMEPIPDDGEPSVGLYNEELKQLEDDKRNTWFTAPWLYAECYLYRLIRTLFLQTEHWRSDDPFREQKMKAFKYSADSILKIATAMHELKEAQLQFTSPEAEGNESGPEKLKVLFNEMVQMCLWGNATDLSLLPHLSQDSIKHLQSVGKEAQITRSKFILRDDQEAVWEHVKELKDAKVDFVLDNFGFEFFTDLVFADFLVTHTPYVSKVVFHPKLIPWFVSDVTPPDFKDTFASLLDPAFFPAEAANASPESVQHLNDMVSRWQGYLDTGGFALSVPGDTPLGGGATAVPAAEFWTTAKPYWDLRDEAPELFAGLEGSGLVIFKGDLNYRKLTGDIKWPSWTPFETALGPLAGLFPLLSLRTNKADVVVGVKREIVEELDKSGEKWRVDGRYALISFSPHSVATL